jgi:polyisoprenoid-binding protein YceI
VANASLHIVVTADSLELKDSISESDRQEITRTMRDEVLEVSRFPQITFDSTTITPTRIAENWYRLNVAGQVNLHGVTKPLSIDAQLRISDGELRLSGDFPLSQATFNIKPVKALGGTIKLKDELKFVFDIVATERSS